ncbi:MAG: PspA/IM30 family protein, partial [Nocardioidaceae bacterium]
GDDIARELEAMSSGSQVESELAALKAKTSGAAIESGASSADPAQPVGSDTAQPAPAEPNKQEEQA